MMKTKVAKISENPYKEGLRGIPQKTPITMKERREIAAQCLSHYLEHMQWKALPKEHKAAMEKKAFRIYGEAKENYEKRLKFIEERGHIPSAKEKTALWNQEYLKVFVAELGGVLKKEAEAKVNQILAGFEGKERKKMENERAQMVSIMQNQLAMNPIALKKEMPVPEIEMAASREKRIENFLEGLLKGKDVPKGIRATLVAESKELETEAKEKADEVAEHRALRLGKKLTRGEYVREWQFQYKKAILGRLMDMSRREAEARVDKTLATLEPEIRETADRESLVKAMQYLLATNPEFLEKKKKG